MVDSLYREVYLSKVISFNRVVNKFVNFATLFLSLLSVVLFKYIQDYIYIILIVFVVIELLKIFNSVFLWNENSLVELISLRAKYKKYYYSLDVLWTKFDSDVISDKKITDEFFRIRKRYEPKAENTKPEYYFRHLSFIKKSANKFTNSYITTHYHGKTND